MAWSQLLKSAVLTLTLALTASCGGGEDDGGATSTALEDRLSELSNGGVFVGGVAFTTNLVAIHFQRGGDDSDPGMQVFVTDGLPDGNAEWFEGTANDGRFSFTSSSGNASIEGTIEAFETDGTVILADGETRHFFTRPAGDGAGVFQIDVRGDGSWDGTSLDGSTLTAQQTGPYVEGEVVSTTGQRYQFRHNDLSRRLGYDVEGGASDSYLTVVTRQATEIQGRGGDVRGGRPSENIISLDLHETATPTPGVYHGRVAFTTDRLNFEIQENDDGTKLVRSYVSDSEPEPDGDIQWFAETVSGSQFDLTSKSGDATISGSIADDGITGKLTLPDGVARRYFTAPSGQGAGIYTVEVTEDRHHTGTSQQGGVLDLRYEGGTVMGTITSPEGEEFPMLGADLAHAFQYEDEYSKPGTYTAFVAPRGRYVFGRSGNVRGGSSGANIIGLDKKC